jgi:hypothetical protein
MLTIDRNLDRLAAEIADDGFTPGVEGEVALVVDRARRTGLDRPALEVLADPAEPAIARARAFGIVTMALAHRPTAAPSAMLSAA